ncbi:mitochondrial import inner membrane translocase subunit TIM50-C-like [Tubulanus polymorphus]|uniref:mitochondrial import inner membrane translocase subunit TIM50-C-like n=1 Tax=Tubulanus polymorphus TaxID=672921 RepID=UPI003DA4E99F
MQSKIAAQESNSGEKEGSKDETKEKEKPSSKWTGKNAWKLGLVFMGGGAVVVGGMILYEWGSPRVDKDGNVVVDEFTELPQWQQIPKRAWREFNFYKQMIRDPSSEKLLPDPLREPYYQPPYTLVLEMTGVLVHPDWTYGTGWRFKKRPGIDYFLQQVGPPLFEVVIYTREQGFTASPILDSLDPNGYITYRLYKDATRYMNGAHIKDLSCLNRDESKVIMVDCDASAVQIQPRNAITLKRWRGADDDRSLVELASLLRAIAASNVDDVRTVLDYYNAHDDPLDVFRENQRKWQEEQERIDAAKQTEQQNQPLVKSYAPGFFRRR